jgi:hypothetical protein
LKIFFFIFIYSDIQIDIEGIIDDGEGIIDNDNDDDDKETTEKGEKTKKKMASLGMGMSLNGSVMGVPMGPLDVTEHTDLHCSPSSHDTRDLSTYSTPSNGEVRIKFETLRSLDQSDVENRHHQQQHHHQHHNHHLDQRSQHSNSPATSHHSS